MFYCIMFVLIHNDYTCSMSVQHTSTNVTDEDYAIPFSTSYDAVQYVTCSDDSPAHYQPLDTSELTDYTNVSQCLDPSLEEIFDYLQWTCRKTCRSIVDKLSKTDIACTTYSYYEERGAVLAYDYYDERAILHVTYLFRLPTIRQTSKAYTIDGVQQHAVIQCDIIRSMNAL